jgi:hypothetical protein
MIPDASATATKDAARPPSRQEDYSALQFLASDGSEIATVIKIGVREYKLSVHFALARKIVSVQKFLDVRCDHQTLYSLIGE